MDLPLIERTVIEALSVLSVLTVEGAVTGSVNGNVIERGISEKGTETVKAAIANTVEKIAACAETVGREMRLKDAEEGAGTTGAGIKKNR